MKRQVQSLLLLLLLPGTGSAVAADTPRNEAEIPEVLRYAREYVREQPVRPARKATLKAESAAQKLARAEMARRQQQIKLAALERELQGVRETLQATRQQAQQAQMTDTPALKAKEASLLTATQSLQKQAIALEEKVRDVARLTQEKGVATAQVQALNSQLALLTGTNRTLQSDNATLQAAQGKAQKDTEILRQSLTKNNGELKVKEDDVRRLTQELAVALTAQKTLTTQVSGLEKQLAGVKEKAAGSVLSLKTEAARQAYATGVMYARDVREASEGNRLLGVQMDSAALTAGLSDALADRALRLTPAELDTAVQTLEAKADQGFRNVTQAQAKAAEAYLKVFRRAKGTILHELGFWYQVSYPGDGTVLKPDDTVDVVVEETLTDGTVISDMEAAGSSLRQAVKDFPPVFAAALETLKNHGQVTLVVPPELAYGDRGYPPKVPPGATMVYRLRVSEVIPAGKPVQKVTDTQKAEGKTDKPAGGKRT